MKSKREKQLGAIVRNGCQMWGQTTEVTLGQFRPWQNTCLKVYGEAPLFEAKDLKEEIILVVGKAQRELKGV